MDGSVEGGVEVLAARRERLARRDPVHLRRFVRLVDLSHGAGLPNRLSRDLAIARTGRAAAGHLLGVRRCL